MHPMHPSSIGLSQVTPIPLWVWRLGFVLLAYLRFGLWIYILVMLAMPVHPEDRPHLLRFRLARWWRGLRARTA
jgi:hypothetical protein